MSKSGNRNRRRRQAAMKRELAALAKQNAVLVQKASKLDGPASAQKFANEISRPNKFWRRLPKPVWAMVGAAAIILGVLVGVPSVRDYYWPQPVVYPSGQDPGNPFTLPFTAQNKSVLFTMHHVIQTCRFESLGVLGGMWKNVPIRGAENTAYDIDSESTRNITCDVSTPDRSPTVVRLSIELDYWRLFIPYTAHYKSQLFAWTRTSDGGRWVAQ